MPERHGGTYSNMYNVWLQMKQRCNNPRNTNYRHYGGRGIKVCEQWQHSFESFRADMGARPAGKMLERINNDGDYEPGNCKWAGYSEQLSNRRKPSHAYNLGNRFRAKLTPEEARAVKYETGMSQSRIASKYGITQSQVSMIKSGRSWPEL